MFLHGLFLQLTTLMGTVLPQGVCHQLRNASSPVGVLSVGIVPSQKRFLLLTSTYEGFAGDLEKMVYPLDAGYPTFREPSPDEAWSMELSVLDAFDTLSAEERGRLVESEKSPDMSGFLLHNASSPNYYVSGIAASNLTSGMASQLEAKFGLPANSSERLFAWRQMGSEGVGLEYAFTSNQVLAPSFCVSSQEASSAYQMRLREGDGGLCFEKATLAQGLAEGEIGVTISSPLPCSSGLPQCGFLLNELLFTLDNDARQVTIYRAPFKGVTTGTAKPLARLPYDAFFVCNDGTSLLVWFTVCLVATFLLVTGTFLCVKHTTVGRALIRTVAIPTRGGGPTWGVKSLRAGRSTCQRNPSPVPRRRDTPTLSSPSSRQPTSR